jgi:hypothetical protein
VFIYFGVACIGLLLGTYIASMLDDRAFRDRKTRQLESCPNCARIQTIQEATKRRMTSGLPVRKRSTLRKGGVDFSSERNIRVPVDHTTNYHTMDQHFPQGSSGNSSILSLGSPHSHGDLKPNSGSPVMSNHSRYSTLADHKVHAAAPMSIIEGQEGWVSRGEGSPLMDSPGSPLRPGTPLNDFLSPEAHQTLHRQTHTRHISIDAKTDADTWATPSMGVAGVRRFSHELRTPAFEGGIPDAASSLPNKHTSRCYDEEDEVDDYSDATSSLSTIDEIVDERTVKIKGAKYVFLTLREALVNSLVIIAVGCLGFWIIEDFSIVDSWYFTTVLLTTTG